MSRGSSGLVWTRRGWSRLDWARLATAFARRRDSLRASVNRDDSQRAGAAPRSPLLRENPDFAEESPDPAEAAVPGVLGAAAEAAVPGALGAAAEAPAPGEAEPEFALTSLAAREGAAEKRSAEKTSTEKHSSSKISDDLTPFIHPTDPGSSSHPFVGTPFIHPTDKNPSVGTPFMHPTDKNLSVGTPFMRQWAAAKRQNPDALVFFRMGDFYELFYDDAAVASRELQLTLTARDKERNIPMCGVPYHAVEQYLTRLLRKGYRIALCDQMEDPKLTKKLVKREVTRVLTPGTALDAGLGQEQNNFLAALWEAGRDRNSGEGPGSEDRSHPNRKSAVRMGQPNYAGHFDVVCAVALLDVSTGEFRDERSFAARMRGRRRWTSCCWPRRARCWWRRARRLPAQLERIPARTRVEDWVWTREFAVPLVERQLNVRSLEGFGLNGHEAAAIAAGAVLHYVRTTQKNEALHIDSLKFEEHSTALELDQVTVRNLELVEPLFQGQDDRATLFRTLDACLTPMGKRLLRATILRPLNSATEIEARYEAVAEAHGDLLKREEMRQGFRRNSRSGAVAGADFSGFGRAARRARARRQFGAAAGGEDGADRDDGAASGGRLPAQLDTLDDVTARIAKTLVAEPPLTLVDGGAIAAGMDAELDELRSVSTAGGRRLRPSRIASGSGRESGR